MLLQARQLCRLNRTLVPSNVKSQACPRFGVRSSNLIRSRFYASAKKAIPTTPPARNIAAKPPAPKPFQPANATASPLPPPKGFTGSQPSTISATAPIGKGSYPESLLIYNVGTGRTVFIASVRLTGILIFIFSTWFIAPAYYYTDDAPTWMAPVVLIGGAIPLLVTTFSTPPLVTYIHLFLPAWARVSHTRLARYATSLPSTATLDITTLVWVWPRVTRLQAGELYIAKNKVGAMTLKRNVPEAVYQARKWYAWRPQKKFLLAGQPTGGGKVVEDGIWEGVLGSVAKGWGRKGGRGTVMEVGPRLAKEVPEGVFKGKT